MARELDSDRTGGAADRFGWARRRGRAGPGLVYRTLYKTPVVGHVVDQLRSDLFAWTKTGKHVTPNTQCQRCGTTYRHVPATRKQIARRMGPESLRSDRRARRKALRHQPCPNCGSNETKPIAVAGWYPDPYGGTRPRYWDGNDWTRRTRAAGPGA